MRTLLGTILGVIFLGMLGLRAAEGVNILVREVRQEKRPEGLSVVYELQNASVDRWDLRRVELHVFDRLGRRLTLLRPITRLARLEREDVDFIEARIPAVVLPEAHRLEVWIFVQEVLGFPVADPIPTRLVYSFPLKSQTIPRVLQARTEALRVERVGMVEEPDGTRTILLRLVNQGPETLSGIVLRGEIDGIHGSLQPIHLRVTSKYVLPGAEAYVSVTVPKSILNLAKGISLRAFYHKAYGPEDVSYVEDLKIRERGGRLHPGGSLRGAGWKPH